MTQERLLLIEDDADLVQSLRLALRRENYSIDHALSGLEGLTKVVEEPPDLLLLDLNLPDMDGLSICREIRGNAATRDLPIIMLTARAQEHDRVLGLDLGADDYIVKPFSVRELKSRIQALLRRRRLDGGVPEDVFSEGRLIVDYRTRRVTLEGVEIHLTARELELLWFLITNRPQVLSRDRILERVWGLSSDVETRTIDVHVRTLRKKIDSDVIETLIGAGYRFRGCP
ncbi:MAG: DNA-binding response regulator [Acidobacteria bacterium]|nr:MAG: DNA-binding response regulator [Acidobacteriota bacterium]RLE33872.1 MAG: DNA-binding response regulator [Acidobacteriota bacterium]